jgi:hypothetical protein
LVSSNEKGRDRLQKVSEVCDTLREQQPLRMKGANSMFRTASILIIIAMLGLHGNVNARLLDGSARTNVIVRRGRRLVHKRDAHRSHARKRHGATAPLISSKTKPRRVSPNDQPANLAPQPEDIPPVKPPKKRLPPADKRNPLR